MSENGDPVIIGCSPITLGRDQGCTLQVADATISKRHAMLFAREEQLHLCDAGSANGTLVNGVRIFERRRLFHGDVIQLGSHRLAVAYLTKAAA